MKTTVRRGSWFLTLPLAAAAVAYIAFSFLPNRRATGKAREQIRQKQDFVVQAGSLAEVLRSVEEQLEESQSYNAAWEQHAPIERELSALYGKIHELARSAGTNITRFDPEPPVRYERISFVPLAVGCDGSFADICGFLEALEGLPPAIWVNELDVSRTGRVEEPVACLLALAVFTLNPENSDYVDRSE